MAVQYEPPGGMTPAEAGTLLDERADMRDVMATLVDLAVRGYLRIEEQGGATALRAARRAKEYVFHRLKPPAGAAGRCSGTSSCCSRASSTAAATSVELSDLKNEFYRSLGGIRDR